MDYVYVRAWGRHMGSHSSYIADQVAQARKDKAPENATYRDVMTGAWKTMDDVQDNPVGNRTRQSVEAIAAKLRGDEGGA